MVGEVVRRVTGRSIDRFLAEEIEAPLGLDLWIGLPQSERHRSAGSSPPRSTSARWPGSTWTPCPSPRAR
ncbi:serine hydrolase [Microbispora bryophytorum]|uniref:serine hydrolase n=1 Tax=Microbispora bryophytorum TaxID=1460882 RepID=UPI0033DAFD51